MIDFDALLAEAAEYADPGLDQGYRPFDADERIPGWKERSPEQPFTRAQAESMEFLAWVAGHGHDPRLKCYIEFGCQAIEGYAHGLVARLAEALTELRQPDRA